MQPTASIIFKEWQKLASDAPKAWYLSLLMLLVMLLTALLLLGKIIFINPEVNVVESFRHNKLTISDLAYPIFEASPKAGSEFESNALFSQFTLQGILFDPNKHSYAIVSYHGLENSYQVGDYLPNRVQVIAIKYNSITLKYGIVEHELHLPNEGLNFLPVTRPLEVNNSRI